MQTADTHGSANEIDFQASLSIHFTFNQEKLQFRIIEMMREWKMLFPNEEKTFHSLVVNTRFQFVGILIKIGKFPREAHQNAYFFAAAE
jgi:hypothetical protein